MEILDCKNQLCKISKSSITVKSENGKTKGIVRNICSLYNLQLNKQMDYYRVLKSTGLYGKINIEECIISDGTMYIFRNIKGKLFYEKYGYISEEEKQRAIEKDNLYCSVEEAGFTVIEYIAV